MNRYVDDPDAVFPVRLVGSGDRRSRLKERQEFETREGSKLMFADNSPAWVLHAWLMAGYLTSYEIFRAAITTIPCHMFDIAKRVPLTIHDLGWYVAHLYPAKNRDTDWCSWSRIEVRRRFYLTLHPCNLFFVPGTRNSEHGEDAEVIGFVAGRYAERYGLLWNDFLEKIGGKPLAERPGFGERLVLALSVAPVTPTIRESSAGEAGVRYKATRLLFRKDAIEPLGIEDTFEIITPMGSFRLTKREFYQEFPGVVKSRSYQDRGLYHYPYVPQRAERFRVR
jgi:hypothetical protein